MKAVIAADETLLLGDKSQWYYLHNLSREATSMDPRYQIQKVSVVLLCIIPCKIHYSYLCILSVVDSGIGIS
jgi:hypothetical protein